MFVQWICSRFLALLIPILFAFFASLTEWWIFVDIYEVVGRTTRWNFFILNLHLHSVIVIQVSWWSIVQREVLKIGLMCNLPFMRWEYFTGVVWGILTLILRMCSKWRNGQRWICIRRRSNRKILGLRVEIGHHYVIVELLRHFAALF